MTGWKKLGTYGSFPQAREKIAHETQHGMAARNYEFKTTKQHVGHSADPAFSDRNGFQWIVWYKVG
jgi:hypothetical protein